MKGKLGYVDPNTYELTQVIGSYTPLRHANGPWWLGVEHDSLVVDEVRNAFWWNSRGATGNVFDWIMHIHNVSFEGALDILRRGYMNLRRVISPQTEPSEPLVLPWQLAHEHNANLTDEGYAWWLNRGVFPQTVNDLLLGQDERSYTIPISALDVSGLGNYKHRNKVNRPNEPRYWQHCSGLSATLYVPFPQLMEEETIVVVGGEIKAIVAGQAGIPVVTSSTGVGTWKKEWSELLKGKHVVIALDPKEHRAAKEWHVPPARRIAEQLTQSLTVREVVLPHDLDDLITKHNWEPERLREALEL